MFAWYKNSNKRYAYLANVYNVDGLSRSRWFTRAWTLQELLAPSHLTSGGGSGMDFFSSDWSCLVGKTDLSDIVTDIWGIEKEYLEGGEIRQVQSPITLGKASTTLVPTTLWPCWGQC